jgi:hypothetical protein
MVSRWVCVALVVSASLAACGGDDGPATSSSGGSKSESNPAKGSSGAAGPKITRVMKMAGGLHVFWELPKTCDGVELERKDGPGEFEVKYKLPGAIDNKHDATATGDTLYTYRARCKAGAEYTEYSNEMGKSPN